MASHGDRHEEIELLRRASSDSDHSGFSERDGYASFHQKQPNVRRGWVQLLFQICRPIFQISGSIQPRHATRLGRPFRWRFALLVSLPSILLLLITFFAVFLPSYTHPPEHYGVLRKRMLASRDAGRGNINSEKVFISATLYDPKGDLVGGEWGKAVAGLVELLGPENVHLSIYEDNAEQATAEALRVLEQRLKCTTSFVTEELSDADIAHARVSSGESLTRRIALLAEVRNRALLPLFDEPKVTYDRVLCLNDVNFDPMDAVQLLFSTNVDPYGRSHYGAVCAMDFINAFKFYDRFAIRDLDGFRSGIPFYPWFTNAGTGTSRSDVLSQSDAVRVRACWGGMAAFEAKWFQQNTTIDEEISPQANAALDVSPLKFRYEEDLYWEASECCLIMADLTYLRQGRNVSDDAGIYVNPYVRVAYDFNSFRWLSFTRRFERLYTFPHWMAIRLLGMPWWRSDGRYENGSLIEPGDQVTDLVWEWDETSGGDSASNHRRELQGAYHDVERVAGPGRLCGYRGMQLMNPNPKPGDKRWMSIGAPPVSSSS